LSSSSELSAPSRNSKSSSTCSRTSECFSFSPCSSPPITVSFSHNRLTSKLITVYAYQGAITAVLFNGRTRALVSLLTGLGSMVGSIIIGLLTDKLPFKRRNRAVVACLAVFLLTAAVWGAGLGFQVQFTRDSVALGTIFKGEPLPWDLKMASAAAGPITLLMACESSVRRSGV
jgi:MFS family permease